MATGRVRIDEGVRVRVGIRLGADARGRALAARIVHTAIVAEGIAMTATRWGADVDPDRLAILGPRGAGSTYWPEVGRLLVRSYRSLSTAVSGSTGSAAVADDRVA